MNIIIHYDSYDNSEKNQDYYIENQINYSRNNIDIYQILLKIFLRLIF